MNFMCSECSGSDTERIASRRFIAGCDVLMYICRSCKSRDADLKPRKNKNVQ